MNKVLEKGNDMYSQEISTKKQSTKVMTFPNKEAIYRMVNKSSNEPNILSNPENKTTNFSDSLFETVLTLILLDENNIENNLFFLIIAALFTD